MAHHNTIFHQLLRFLPRHEFEQVAKHHHVGQKFRKTSRWAQFIALAFGQLSGRQSLRDIVLNMKAQVHSLYHLGSDPIARSSFARLNEQQPYTLYEALFSKLYTRCKGLAPGHRFRFKNKLYSIDSSLIDLSLSIFPWAHFCKGKAAMKLHVGVDHSGYLPAFATITHGHVSDLDVAKTLSFSAGSIVVCDRGYLDYGWFNTLTEKGIFFVTRPRKNAVYRVLERRSVNKDSGLTSDQTVRFTGVKPRELNLPPMRRVGYRDPVSGKHYVFVTNLFHLSATTIAAIYKERWQIELFFKWIKQNLKIKTFLGTSRNAILTQIWVALCLYLMLTYMKFSSKIQMPLQQLLRLLQVNLFIRRDLMALLRGDPPVPKMDRRQQPLCFT